MLRSQGIPARLVVGFHGGDYNAMAGSFMVRGRHAHAWVEAYLRPEDCTPEMIERGEAGSGGAWLLADPTPTSFEEDLTTVGGDAIDSGSQHVAGLCAGHGRESKQFGSQSRFRFRCSSSFRIWTWRKFNAAMTQLRKTSRTKSFRYIAPIVIVAPFLLIWLISLFRRKDDDASGNRKSARGSGD
jgi:hypothetical protein